jgi:hypothetical protein
MSTIGSREKKKEWDKRYCENLCKDAGKMKEREEKQVQGRELQRVYFKMLKLQVKEERKE